MDFMQLIWNIVKRCQGIVLLKNKLTIVALSAEFHVLEEKKNNTIILSEGLECLLYIFNSS